MFLNILVFLKEMRIYPVKYVKEKWLLRLDVS